MTMKCNIVESNVNTNTKKIGRLGKKHRAALRKKNAATIGATNMENTSVIITSSVSRPVGDIQGTSVMNIETQQTANKVERTQIDKCSSTTLVVDRAKLLAVGSDPGIFLTLKKGFSFHTTQTSDRRNNKKYPLIVPQKEYIISLRIELQRQMTAVESVMDDELVVSCRQSLHLQLEELDVMLRNLTSNASQRCALDGVNNLLREKDHLWGKYFCLYYYVSC